MCSVRHISGFAILQLYTDEYRAPWLCSQAPYECMPGCSLCGITIWELLRRHGRGEPVLRGDPWKVAVVLGLGCFSEDLEQAPSFSCTVRGQSRCFKTPQRVRCVYPCVQVSEGWVQPGQNQGNCCRLEWYDAQIGRCILVCIVPS